MEFLQMQLKLISNPKRVHEVCNLIISKVQLSSQLYFKLTVHQLFQRTKKLFKAICKYHQKTF